MTNTTNETISWEKAKVEYENALQQYQYGTGLRRQDMAFVTTVQVAILTIIAPKLLSLDVASLFLSIIAFFTLLLGINNERRLAAYLKGYMCRAEQIESEHGLSLLSLSGERMRESKLLFSNTVIFPLYYFAFIIAWIGIWILNLLT